MCNIADHRSSVRGQNLHVTYNYLYTLFSYIYINIQMNFEYMDN